MSVINCYYIVDVICLCELVSTRDIAGLDVNYLEPPVSLPQYQLMTHSQYFKNHMLSFNLYDGCEWFCERRSQFKYL
jgi:hypothetical protein